MLQIVYWGMAEYTSAEAKGATDGLVEQSKALLLRVRCICILALYCNAPTLKIFSYAGYLPTLLILCQRDPIHCGLS